MIHNISLILSALLVFGGIAGNVAAEEIQPEPIAVETFTAETILPPVSLGIFTATAYCPCISCSEGWGAATATGAIATAGRTIAVDPSVIPYGTRVIINGHTYVAEDCGGAIKGNRIDIYFDTHADTTAFGVRQVEVFVEG